MTRDELRLREWEGAILFGHEVREGVGDPSLGVDIRAVASAAGGMGEDLDSALYHLHRILDRAPFLMMARSNLWILPSDARHAALAKRWRGVLSEAIESVPTLLNAAEFFLGWNERCAREAIDRVCRLDPDDSFVLRALAEFHSHGADLGWEGCSHEAARATLLRAIDASPIPHFVSYLGHAAMAAYLAGSREEARSTAERAIALQPVYLEENVHLGHTVLGLLAADDANVGAASEALARAERGAWGSWGPSLRLARRLSEVDRVEEVGRFLRAVRGWRGRRPAGVEDEWERALLTRRFAGLVNPGR